MCRFRGHEEKGIPVLVATLVVSPDGRSAASAGIDGTVRVWETRDAGRRMLTYASYQQMGGVTGALASHADNVVQELGQTKQALVRAVLLRLVTPDRTRAIVPLDELRELSREHGEVQRLVDQMVDARLLVVQTMEGGKGSTVEIRTDS